MFTRLLQPQQPPAVVAQARTVARPRPKRAAVAPVAPQPAQIASAPAQAASEPAPAGPEESGVAVAAAPSPVEPGDGVSELPAPAVEPPLQAPPNLDTWPSDSRVNYNLTGYFRGPLYGNADVQWLRQDQRYETRVEINVRPFVSLALTSQGDVTPQGLMPRAYEERRRSGPRIVRLEDDAIVINDGRRIPKPSGVQDTASQFVDLGHRFSTGQEKMEPGHSVQVWLARPGGVDLWTYDVLEPELLETPGFGTLQTFHLRPRPVENPRGNITAEIWVAPSLQYLPVRIRVNMGEAWVDLTVDSIQQR
jgi:hypothetical protein